MSVGSGDLLSTTRNIPLSHRTIKSISRRKKKKKRKKLLKAVRESRIFEVTVFSSTKKAFSNATSQRSNPHGRFQRGKPLEDFSKRLKDRRALIQAARNNPGSTFGLKKFRKSAPKGSPRLIPKRKSASSTRSVSRRNSLRRSNTARKTGGQLSRRSTPGKKKVGKLY